MNEFLTIALTFPTLPYSILLSFCVLYWLLAATGLLDVQLDGTPEMGDAADAAAAAGLLVKLGLGGVPLMAMLAVLSFTSWLCSYYLQILLPSALPSSLHLLLAAICFVVALVGGIVTTSIVLRPVRRMLRRLRPALEASLLGRCGTVISPVIDQRQGRVEVKDGGAGLILQVRSPPGLTFLRGERVVLLARDEANHVFTVISENEFNRR